MKTNRLTQLLVANRAAPREFRAEAGTDEATIYLYDMIGEDFWTGEGVTAKRFIETLSAIAAPVIHLRINSPGGDVFEARTITAAMDAHPAKFVAHIDGLAASAASFIAARADEVEMSAGSFLMVHNAWTFAMGNRHDLLSTAAFLEKIDASIADDYVTRTGAERAVVVGWMDAETWFTADEALAAGLSDRTATKAEQPKNTWNLTAFEHAPAALTAAPAPTPPAPTPEPEIETAAECDRRLRALRLVETEPA